ncbi:unnamed protein product [Knipowitschia caucasica]|uniref:RNase NYN domain-containing protein n=1 Tax=Knipowitschia caucasica TaxID=637954 RepID=A0AAV2KQX3_KNICA
MDSACLQEAVEDEFTCPGTLRGSVTSLHSCVQRLFRVDFTIGTEQHDSDSQIWLRLRGLRADVQAAKLFVRGVVNQEQQQEVLYPLSLHCVFCGAGGLFMDCLTRSTSAHIMVGSPGCLLVSGLMEPVVRAFSLISELVERCEPTQSKRSDLGERGLGESLESRRTFKNLVEQWDDRHTLDLLVLPGSVKEILLDLVKEAKLGDDACPPTKQEDSWDRSGSSLGEFALPDAMTTNFIGKFSNVERNTVMNSKSPQENGEGEDRSTELSGGKEFSLLLKFFTAMGYTEDVVKRVLAKTGIQEASQILDLVQQEQDRTDKLLRIGSQNKPCETEHSEEAAKSVLSKRQEMFSDGESRGGATGGGAELRDEDFVLGVLKKAAASCGYNEERVSEVYAKLPDQSMHQLLLELQQKDAKEEGPREMDDVEVVVVSEERGRKRGENQEKAREVPPPKQREVRANRGNEENARELQKQREVRGDVFVSDRNPKIQNGQKQADNIRGPPLSSYNFDRPQTEAAYGAREAAANTKVWGRERRDGFHQQGAAAVVVTGEQRFLEGLHSRFELHLTSSPGKENLRNIVIDGSNVAMSHGLGQFFSCRGIALAVQHFWDRGHRQICAMVPQWRTKNDHRIKEQHFLTKLTELGIVSLTPSREVQGKRISSYDDRMMVRLAWATEGVIVTNDNLRDLADECAEWTEVIRKRLLQYTFVGDLFMVPDDPLGRGGPHLDDFLSTNTRSANSTIPKMLTYRDRSPGTQTQRPYQSRPNHTQTQRPGQSRALRSPEQTTLLQQQLSLVFPGQESMVSLLLQSHPQETDVNALSAMLLGDD